MNDFLGKEIKQGDYIAYAVRDGDTAAIRGGIVTGFGERIDGYSSKKSKTIKATAAINTWGDKYLIRRVTLGIPDRIIVLGELPDTDVARQIKAAVAEAK
jgi:hypothetical protein